jgi:FAD/FMN-containing dehydrogenase
MNPPLIEALRQIVGPRHVITSADQTLDSFEIDWRGRYHGKALCVVLPASTTEVAEVVQVCLHHQTSIVTQGGNTGLVGGGVPDSTGSQVVLQLRRMNQILHLDSANSAMTVQAGCILQNLQLAAQQQGFLLPLSLAAEGSCTIGGNLACNAGGTQVIRYGNARDLCLGLEVVTAQGEVWEGLSALRKDNTGYDLKNLFIGSEGTLGIITAATLKLFPLPACKLTAWVALPDLLSAVALLQLARSHLAAGLTGFEVMNHFSLGLVQKHYPHLSLPLPLENEEAPWCVLLEQSDFQNEAHARQLLEHFMEHAFTQGLIKDAVIAQSIQQSDSLWHLRESIPLAQAAEGLNIKHDISLPISKIPAFVQSIEAVIQQNYPGVRIVNFGHLGDGNLHFNIQAAPSDDAKAFLMQNEASINELVYAAVKAHQGSISAEHGIGQLKVDELKKHKSAVALELMRRIKRSMDPLNVLNPGRVISL